MYDLYDMDVCSSTVIQFGRRRTSEVLVQHQLTARSCELSSCRRLFALLLWQVVAKSSIRLPSPSTACCLTCRKQCNSTYMREHQQLFGPRHLSSCSLAVIVMAHQLLLEGRRSQAVLRRAAPQVVALAAGGNWSPTERTQVQVAGLDVSTVQHAS